MDNSSGNVCNLSYHEEISSVPFIAISVAHIFVVIVPSLLLGITILYRAFSDKKMRDPVTALFCAETIAVTISPAVIGLLVDISMIADLPLLGSCSNRSRAIYNATTFFLRMLNPWQMVLISTVQFIVIKNGVKKVTIRRVLVAFGTVTAVVAVTSIILTVPSEYSGALPTIRGSWCETNDVTKRNSIFQSAIAAVTIVIMPATLVLVASIGSYKIVKRNVIDSEKAAIRSVIIVCVTTLILEFLFKLPLAILAYLSSLLNNVHIYYFGISFSDTEYCFILLLFMTTHRGIRNAVFSKVIHYFGNQNTVVPQNSELVRLPRAVLVQPLD